MKRNKKKTSTIAYFECMECGRKFSRPVPLSLQVKCPRCGNYDTEIISAQDAKSKKPILF
jgi:DNA polymerase II large subunit